MIKGLGKMMEVNFPSCKARGKETGINIDTRFMIFKIH